MYGVETHENNPEKMQDWGQKKTYISQQRRWDADDSL